MMSPHPSPRYTARPARMIASLCAAAFAAAAAATAPLQSLELRLYDLRLRLLAERTQPAENIVIVAIDDDSLDQLAPQWGRWPWPRHVMARALQHCAQAQTIVLDVLFAEADLNHPAGDRALADAAKQHGGVFCSAYLLDRDEAAPPPDLSPSPLPRLDGPGPSRLLRRTTLLTPYEALLESSAGVGMVNYLADNDGVLRGHAIVGMAGQRLVPSLALAAALHAQKSPPDAVDVHRGSFRFAGRTFPLDAYGRFPLLPSATPHRTISIADVLLSAEQEARGDPPIAAAAEFRDRIVLVGSMATGLQGDRLVTSLSAYVPGVSSMATALDNLLSGHYVRRTALPWQILLLIVAALGPAFPSFRRPRHLLLGFFLFAVLYAATVHVALLGARLMLPVTLPILGLAVSATAMGALFWTGEHARRRMLEQSDIAKQQFTDMLVHDLRNQVAPVALCLSLLREKRVSDQKDLERLIDSSINNVKRLAALTGALLDIRQMNEGKMPLQLDVHVAAEILDEVVKGHAAPADRTRLRVVHAADAPAHLYVDRELILRMLANLIGNALRHSEAGSDVELGWGVAPGGGAVLWVANRGDPIPPEEQEAILRPFITGSGARHGMFRGVGLGLAFCKLAAEAHQGSIRIESPWQAQGCGVRIEIYLPDRS